eukprot:g2538.t1
MHRAFEAPRHFFTQQVDLVTLGGDLVNFPSLQSVEKMLTELTRLQVPFLYTSGNHDWHLERLYAWEKTFDAQMWPTERGPLQKLYTASKGAMSKQ